MSEVKRRAKERFGEGKEIQVAIDKCWFQETETTGIPYYDSSGRALVVVKPPGFLSKKEVVSLSFAVKIHAEEEKCLGFKWE